MIKHDVSQLADSYLEPVRCLRVLVPASSMDTAMVARRILELANALSSRVQLIGLCQDAAHEPGLRRQLAALSAMVGNERIPVESKIESGHGWLNAIRAEWCKGDVIACFAEQRSGFTGRPLNQILESNLNSTVYVLNGIHPQQKWQRSSWISDMTVWTGSIAIILGFLALQLKITQLPQDWTQTILFCISIIAEGGVIWFWNSLFG